VGLEYDQARLTRFNKRNHVRHIGHKNSTLQLKLRRLPSLVFLATFVLVFLVFLLGSTELVFGLIWVNFLAAK
jgi:hypothetical protein